MVNIDLSFISYRAFQNGDIDEGLAIPNQVTPNSIKIDLSAIKYRAKEIGDAEDN